MALADGPADNRADNVRPVPRKGTIISQEVRDELEQGITKLGAEIDALRDQLKKKPALLALLPDVQIFHNAIRYAVRYNEIFNPTNEIPAAKNLFKAGLDRAPNFGRANLHGFQPQDLLCGDTFQSWMASSVQPYGLVVPSSYKPNTAHRFRLDFSFHGRGEELSELNFLRDRMRSPGEFTPRDTIVLHRTPDTATGRNLQVRSTRSRPLIRCAGIILLMTGVWWSEGFRWVEQPVGIWRFIMRGFGLQPHRAPAFLKQLIF